MAPATLRANLALPLIAPQYTTDNSGTYPTANWRPTGNQNVLNHQGNKDGGAQWDGQTSWNGDPTNRTNSYIEYGGTGDQADYAIRKYARETTTPGLFDVYLNVRGNVQKEITPLDLVLVVDWSGSMNENNRIGEVQKGVNRFVDTLADSGITNNINMGYVGYSSDGYNNNAIQMGPFDTVKNPIKNITPSSTRGGTFTQKALRDAGDMLATPNGHKKVIVLLTDGVPTFSYKVSRVQTEADGRFYGTQFTNRQDQPGSTSYISGSYNAPDQNNISKRINSTFIATIGEAMALKQRGIEIHGLGIQLQSDPRANLSKQQVEDKMREMVSFLTWNYFINAMGMTWGSYFGVDFTQDAVAGSGLTMMAGIKTLDTSIIGAIIISGIVTALHNRLFDKKLPVFLGIFQGTSYVVIIAFLVMIPCAWLTLLGWPKVQMGIESLQAFLRSAGALGVWVYTFLERILIPTGLHHFIYGPFIFGPAAVEGGIQMYWAQHLQEFSLSAEPLKSLFPEGGFALHGNSKIFGAVGISLAMYFTAAPENRVKVAGLLIPATLTAMLVGITEPLEFTFLFISPLLFAVHAVLAASMSTVMYLFGVVGNMGGGLIDQVLPQNWIPMFSNHADMMLTQIAIGLCFTLLYFVVFRTLILQFNMCTPGREDAEVKLYSKAEYKASRGQTTAAEPKKELDQAAGILQALGGVGNISSINNCATRLRIALHDMSQTLDDEVFKKLGAHGVFRSGDAIQVIIGLHVSQLREQLDSLINSHQSAENVAITEAV